MSKIPKSRIGCQSCAHYEQTLTSFDVSKPRRCKRVRRYATAYTHARSRTAGDIDSPKKTTDGFI